MTAAARSWQDVLPGAVVMAPRELPRARSVLALLARFAAGQGIPASPQWLLDYDVVEAFCVRGCAGRAAATRGTYRSVLYRLAASVHGPPGRRGTPFPGSKAPAPYSPGERAELAAVARAQRDPARRASALAMVVFGIGAGLRPGELAALRGADVVQAGGQVIVRVTGGPAPRTVPVAPRYAGRAAGLARAAGGEFVFRPGPADRAYKNFVNVFAARLATDPAAPRLSASRCRAGFICDHLAAGTPIPALLAISGIAGPESLARYARHVVGLTASKAALRARWVAERKQ
jgi:integrase